MWKQVRFNVYDLLKTIDEKVVKKGYRRGKINQNHYSH